MADQYKDTINLPQTDFPMRGNLPKREPALLEQWQRENLYDKLQQQREGCKPFILHDGPPYANGDIHIGHAVNKVLKDIIVKSRVLSGYRAAYVPGWDCHGLPIELMVEKKVGKVGQKVDAKTFRQACREYAHGQIEGQRRDFIRLGVWGDWLRPYLTLDRQYEADMLRALARIIEAGHLHKGEKPVNWCFDCGSALAEAEIEYRDKTSPAVDVAFHAADPAAVAGVFDTAVDSRPVSLVIWTTTPWTLPANRAIALHPELPYVLLDAGERGRFIVAEALADSTLLRWGLEATDRAGPVPGQALAGLQFQHPFLDLQVPVLMGEHVTTESGTGAVHTAPAHGEDDFRICKAHDIKPYNPVGPDGVFLPDTPLVGGQFVWKANQTIIDHLQNSGHLLHKADYQHSYPHCWRHKSPTAFRTTPQWFISMDGNGLRDQARAAIRQVRWVPDWGQQRIDNMITNRPDWCISRQRTWGVPIALFSHKQTGQPHPDSARLLREIAQRVEREGIDCWDDIRPEDYLGDDAPNYEKVTDILDVWFDSGVSHHCVLARRDELAKPADLYLEGSDQHRGWFHSSLLTGVAMDGQAPYRQVLTHGFTVDANGHKMSKSRGNVVPPLQVVQTLGADILRLWVASCDYRYEMTVSDEVLKRVADVYRRIRNTARFLLGNLHGFNPERHMLETTRCLPLDRWAVSTAARAQDEILQAYEEYDFNRIYQRLQHFCAVDMGAFWLDIIKDRLYTLPTDAPARRSAQTAMYHILQAMVRWMTPILSFTAEEIWQHLPGQPETRHAHFATWYRELERLPENAPLNHAFWQQIMAVRHEVSRELERLRQAGHIGSSLQAEVTLFADTHTRNLLERLQDELRFILLTSTARVAPLEEAPEQATASELEGLKLTVAPSKAGKCVRCWHFRDDVGTNPAHPQLCGRCIDNITGPGEQRCFG